MVIKESPDGHTSYELYCKRHSHAVTTVETIVSSRNAVRKENTSSIKNEKEENKNQRSYNNISRRKRDLTVIDICSPSMSRKGNIEIDVDPDLINSSGDKGIVFKRKRLVK